MSNKEEAQRILPEGTRLIQRDGGKEYFVYRLNEGRDKILVNLKAVDGTSTVTLEFSDLMTKLNASNGSWRFRT